MKNKRFEFEIPFIGYDYGKEHGWNYDTIIGKYGNPIVGIKIKNTVEQYSADPEEYLKYHTVLNQIVKTIGENRIIQKIDIFSKKIYKEKEIPKEFLQKKYIEHFNGRLYKTIDTILLFTDVVIDSKKKKNSYSFSERKYKDLRDRCSKIFLLLKQYDFNPKYMFEKDFERYLSGVLTMQLGDRIKYDNIKSSNEYLNIGNQFVKFISLVDVENIELPSEIETYTELGGNGAAKETAVDNFTFINELEDYNTILYNQVISIPQQAQRQRELDRKKRRHEGAASSSPSNGIIAEEIEALLTNIAIDGQFIVDAHFSIGFATSSLESMETNQSIIESKLFTKGIIVSRSAYNQLELFRSALPGNAVELKGYDLFTTTSEAALCFFFKESYPIDEESNFYLRFSDRQGVPLKIDTADLPMKTGRINNRNKFVLGPSGSGKSFLMNNIVEQYLTYNYDVVIVDTGDSYSSTCAYYGGKYIQYTEEKPITMNPFHIEEKEFNIEKIEFLSNLIFLIWRGAEANINNTEKSILDNLLMSYYHQFFKGGTRWYENKNNTELEHYLRKYNYTEKDLERELENGFEESKTLYDILGVTYDDTTEVIKQKGRKLIMLHHPDHNIDNPNYDKEKYLKIQEAYRILTDEKERKIYNETELILKVSNTPRIKPKNREEWETEYRKMLIKKIEHYETQLNVTELSFNSFYEYCEKSLPIFLEGKHKIKEEEFNKRTFFRVLADFYKGGRYEKTLNESSNNNLFSEKFIVFEIDNVKDNPKLFPIVTLIIMDTFIQKMRLRSDRRKALIIEEAWKAIANKLMGGYILYLYKTVRKFWGEAIVVTQELDDIIGNTLVKDAIINNSDTFVLLDQTKFKDNFDRIAALLSLNQIEQNKIFTINNLDNKFGRSRFKEFYLKRGSKGEVYGNEVSIYQYLTYTTEKPQKSALQYYVKELGDYNKALSLFVKDAERLRDGIDNLYPIVNLYKKPINDEVIQYYWNLKKKYKGKNIFKIIEEKMEDENLNFEQLIKNEQYETV
ncbi:TraG/VirB4 family ATPase [Riemerella columbipharyngis]|uniref:Bacteroides conjugation system ATPase, TraG family n=1 Tax=Riemerella columbipharyngis TaxID=1071918 RepID=A0A1G6ZB98_9FLAO|nr:DnaJ domain-containing protein [Riemerella columbipharyngis]SDD99752.1 Bacteroides conjugation system ATPase, TraG family [Riemerella columbipharyngis]